MSVYEQLDIDETEGIDETEIAAIKATLSRIKVVAAGVAKDNDTTDTLAILKEVEKVVRRAVSNGVHSVDELHQQLATNSSGQPAAALGAGSGGTQPPAPAPITNETEALNILFQSPSISNGIKAAIRRMLTPGDKQALLVEADGTPSDLKTTRDQRDEHKTKAETAKGELTKVLRDVGQALGGVSIPIDSDGKVTSSIKDMITAGLTEAERQGQAAAGNLPKTDVKTAVDKIADAWNTKRKARTDNDKTVIDLPQNREKIDEGLQELEQLVS